MSQEEIHFSHFAFFLSNDLWKININDKTQINDVERSATDFVGEKRRRRQEENRHLLGYLNIRV